MCPGISPSKGHPSIKTHGYIPSWWKFTPWKKASLWSGHFTANMSRTLLIPILWWDRVLSANYCQLLQTVWYPMLGCPEERGGLIQGWNINKLGHIHVSLGIRYYGTAVQYYVYSSGTSNTSQPLNLMQCTKVLHLKRENGSPLCVHYCEVPLSLVGSKIYILLVILLGHNP